MFASVFNVWQFEEEELEEGEEEVSWARMDYERNIQCL